MVATAGISAEQFCLGFAKYLSQRGYRVFLIADGVEYLALSNANPGPTFVSVSMERDPRPLRDLSSLFRMLLTLRRIRPDVLVYGTPKASLLAAISGQLLRVPVRVYQIWGLRLETVGGPMRLALGWLERLTSRCSTKLLANSHSLASRYVELGLAEGKMVDVLGMGSSHGVDLDRFSRKRELARDADTQRFLEGSADLTVGFVGRLHPDKGLDTLVAAVEKVARAGVAVRLLLVGRSEGSDGGIGRLAGVVPFHFTGEVEDPRGYYAGMDVLALPSLREGFPNVILEAAAMMIPSIVSDGTGVVDSVVDGLTGVVVPVGDVNQLAHAILHFANQKDRLTAMGNAARKHVETHYDESDVFADLHHYIDPDCVGSSLL